MDSSLTIVLKLGTTSICDELTHVPLLSTLSLVIETIIKLKSLNHRVILVSSGAIGTGLRTLGITQKPAEMAKKQVAFHLIAGGGCCRPGTSDEHV